MASRVSATRHNTRVPFSDATSRANRTQQYAAQQAMADTKLAAYAADTRPAAVNAYPADVVPEQHQQAPDLAAEAQDVVAEPGPHDSHYAACEGFPNRKSHIGPWQLGKTLGKGSSARVRAARHCSTGQAAAVKIIAKKTARMTQSGSIAQLDQVERGQPENSNGIRRMPLAREREVAILKLIEHPNIVKLFDIWENRNEIYLILEYVENGDLFTYISCNGPLTEESSLYVFRQMMSAVQYCHQYNICHRDLKLENILLKADGQIKIADFGMAALHQGPRDQLRTSCGSPHYAAPELLKARPYNGDKVDIWSMGVILFVMLAGRLPFDEDDIRVMLAKAKKGIYIMPPFFTPEAKDLVHRILQVEPETRISMEEMWLHPLVWKYGYLDELGGSSAIDASRGTQVRPLDLASIDTQIFRQLRSMWHSVREDDLAAKLVSNEPNDQKLFYWLLYNYRERQQENFNPTLTHSVSDYHHVNQPSYRKVSTRQFSQARAPGHKRSVSRFTVISNVAETEVGTEKSYDPYKPTSEVRPGQYASRTATHSRIVVHRSNSNAEAEVRSIVQAESAKAAAAATMAAKRQRRGGTPGVALAASRGSMSSIRSTRSAAGRHGTPVRPASRYRRGVDFSHVRKTSAAAVQHRRQRSISNVSSMKMDMSMNMDMDVSMPDVGASCARLPEQSEAVVAPVGAGAASDAAASHPGQEDSLVWNDDLSGFSNRIAKDLDEAFMSSLLSVAMEDAEEEGRGCNSPFSLRLSSPDASSARAASSANPTVVTANSSRGYSAASNGPRPWDSRPLPPSPPRSDSIQLEIIKAQARQQRTGAAARSTTRRPVSTPSRADSAAPASTTEEQEQRRHDNSVNRPATRRVVSAPATASQTKASVRPLSSIFEMGGGGASADREKPRVVSAPSSSKHRGGVSGEGLQNEGLDYLARAEDTIRVVVSPTAVRARPAISEVATQTENVYMGGKDGSAMASAQAVPQQRLSLLVRDEQNAEAAAAAAAAAAPAPPRRAWFRWQTKTADGWRSTSHGNTSNTSRKSSNNSNRSSSATKQVVVDSVAAMDQELDKIKVSESASELTRKKSFLQLPPFWKNGNKSDTKLQGVAKQAKEADIGGMRKSSRGSSKKGSSRNSRSSKNSSSWFDDEGGVATGGSVVRGVKPDDQSSVRKIEPQRNWLARLFRVKPARRHLCLVLSQRRVRQELSQLLREWRVFGIRDIEVDKERNIVFARVAANNYLGIRAVSFACEIITVIEHGKRHHLSIVRMTQETGSANSFHKVADTIKSVLRERQFLVTDRRRARMMVRTLNS